jgi:signal peptidase I
MMPTLNPGDVVVDRPVQAPRPGQIVTFRHSALTSDVVTHRITSVRHGVVHTKGDANRTADVWDIRPNQLRGTMATRIPHLGYLLVFLKQPAGVGSVMALALTAMLLWGLFFPSDGQLDRTVRA